MLWGAHLSEAVQYSFNITIMPNARFRANIHYTKYGERDSVVGVTPWKILNKLGLSDSEDNAITIVRH